MTLRRDVHGKPIGLDWSACTDGSPNPVVWTNWRPATPEPKERRERSSDEREAPKDYSRQRLSPATESLIVRMYRDENKSAREVALAAGVKPPTVFKVLNRNGVPSRGYHQTIRAVTPEQEIEIVRRYVDELQSSGQIAKDMKVSNRTVTRALQRHEVQMRSASESAILDRRRRAQQSA